MDGDADSENLIVDEPVGWAKPWWRRHLVGLVAICGFVVLSAWGIGAWAMRPHAPDYSGRTVAATFDYDCLNGIFWDDPMTDYPWWAGQDPALPADLDTSQPSAASIPMHHTKGELHFDTATRATFTSDAGGQLVLTRQSPKQFYTADCRVS